MKGDVLDFIDDVRSRCDANKVDLMFLPRAGVFGYFDAAKLRVEVSVDERDWLLILAHEVAHMEQWAEGLFMSVWPETGPYELFDAWLEGKANPNPRQLLTAVRTIQKCELDAETRAIKDIGAYGLTKDLESYIGRAWCNVMSYELGRRHRVWWTDDKPFPWDVPEIRDRLPKRLPKVADLGKLDSTLEHLILAHCTEHGT